MAWDNVVVNVGGVVYPWLATKVIMLLLLAPSPVRGAAGDETLRGARGAEWS